MTNLTFDQQLLVLWIGTAVFGVAAATWALVWAIRSGQFQDQDRARYLPLHSHVPLDEFPGDGLASPGRHASDGDRRHASP